MEAKAGFGTRPMWKEGNERKRWLERLPNQ